MSKSDQQDICLQFPGASDAAHRSDYHLIKSLSLDPLNKSFFGLTDEAVLGMDLFMHQSDLNDFERPLFSVGVLSDSHRGACTQCCEQKFIWIWTGIAAADLDRFVRLESVWSYRDILQESSIF
jgi:hypothetical protein